MKLQKDKLPCVMTGYEFKFIKLVDSKNQFHNKIPLREAIDLARNEDLEVVCFTDASDKDLAFCKIINFGKWKYSQEKKKKKESQVHKKSTKEVRVGIDISDNDLSHKIKQANEFLSRGDDVVFSMFLKGRQKTRIKDAILKMDEIMSMCSEFGVEGARHNVIPNVTLRVCPLSSKEVVKIKKEEV